jgi:RimJ/RimL family protein N-acetyltransferase
MFNEIFSYAFDTLRAARVTALSRSKNQKANKFIEHIGFKPEGVMRKAFQDDDLNIYGFLAEEYYSHAWYRGKNG